MVDLDGTLCNFEHRRHLIETSPKQWDHFHSLMCNDKPNYSVASVVALHLQFGYQVFFVTGRFQSYRDVTNSWIDEHLYCFGQIPILMRDDGDHRPDDEVKEEIYHAFIEPSFDVKLVLDDRDHVVKMWRRLGLECWQVARGDY